MAFSLAFAYFLNSSASQSQVDQVIKICGMVKILLLNLRINAKQDQNDTRFYVQYNPHLHPSQQQKKYILYLQCPRSAR